MWQRKNKMIKKKIILVIIFALVINTDRIYSVSVMSRNKNILMRKKSYEKKVDARVMAISGLCCFVFV